MAAPRKDPGRTREEVARLLDEGMTLGAVARRLGVSKPTVSYHARQLGRPPDERANRRYDWDEVQRFYDDGNSITRCRERFGMSRAAFVAAVRRGAVVTRPQAMPIHELLEGTRDRKHVKLRLIAAGLKADACERCGLTDWQGAAISLQLHHVNGDGADNRLENLQLLCPNCHSQTDTFAGRNRRRPPPQAAA